MARVRDVLLRISGDPSDAEQALQDVAEDLRKFDGKTATATVDINTQAADRKMEAAKDSVRDFGRMTAEAKLDLQERGARAKLDRLNKDLENLSKKDASPKVDIAIAGTIAKIDRVEASLDRLDRRRVDINVDVDRHGRAGGLAGGIAGGIAGGVSAIGSGLATATEGLGAFITGASKGIPIIGSLAQGVIGLVASASSLAPVLLILVPLIGVALAGAVALLAGAVVALGASFLTAAAGVGVLGVALAAALGPAVLVAIAAMARFAKILEAVKGAQDNAAQSAEKVKAANAAQAQAQQAAGEAAQRVTSSAAEGYRAWRDAAEAASDAVRGVTDAQLSLEQSKLNLAQAKQDLEDFRKENGLASKSLDDLFTKFTDVNADQSKLGAAIKKAGFGGLGGGDDLDLRQKVLNVAKAHQDVANSVDGVSDAHTRLGDAAATEKEFTDKGIAAYTPYAAAVQASADAHDALTESIGNVAKAKGDDPMKGLSPTERRLAGALGSVKDTVGKAVGPATDKIFGGVITALKDISGFAKDSRVKTGLKDIGGAIGGMFATLGRELRGEKTKDAFKDFAKAGANIIRTLTPVFTAVFGVIRDLAQATLPWLLTLVRRVGRRFRDWAGDVKQSGVEAFVHRVRTSFTIWMGIVKDLWDIVKEFFGDANDAGDTLAGHIHDILTDFRKWLQEHPDAMKKFFEKSAKFAGDLVDALPTIVQGFKDIHDFVNATKWPFEQLGKARKSEFVNPIPGADLSRSQIAENTKILVDPRSSPAAKAAARKRMHDAGVAGYAFGGTVPGAGTGDIVPAMLEPGEYVIRRSVAQAIGVGRLNLINSGRLPRGMQAGGMVIHQQDVHLPPAPGHDQLGDARHQAVMFARELARRGGTPVHR